MDFIFDPVNHEYKLNGRKLLNITYILKICGITDDRFYTEEGKIRGTYVHKCCHFIAENDLNWEKVLPEYLGYVQAYDKYVKDTGWKPDICEKPDYHKTLLYAGTSDQILLKPKTILELKTGTMMWWTKLQTALQAMMMFPDDYYNVIRIGLELHEDGTNRLEFFEDDTDFDEAMTLISMANMKLKYNLIKEK